MSDIGPVSTSGSSRGAKIALLVVLGLVVVPVVGVTYWLYWPDVWQGEVAAVVRRAPEPPSYSDYRVTFTAPLPPEALDRDEDGGLVFERRSNLAAGDRVVCQVRQTYQNSTDIATGPRTEVLRCRR
jgi:hypothetical protein